MTRKITQSGGSHQVRGLQKDLYLGNLDATPRLGLCAGVRRGHVADAAAAEAPADYVVATGRTYSVRDFVRLSFAHVGLDWEEHVRSTLGTCVHRRWTR